jgi:hypothetical protein
MSHSGGTTENFSSINFEAGFFFTSRTIILSALEEDTHLALSPASSWDANPARSWHENDNDE